MTSLSATYYVSQRTGSDENDGRTCSTAFASLSAVNRRHLQPGDRVLLERGSVFYGQYLHVTDSGTKEAPIVIGAYGTADAPPRIDNVLGGGLFLGAFFMATDYVTSPVTKKGQLIFGIGCGLITVFIRYFGSYPEGVCYSILVMNCCTWIIDKYTKPTRFGVDKKAAKEAAKK